MICNFNQIPLFIYFKKVLLLINHLAMFHFFAKIGKKPWARSVLPLCGAGTSLSYLCFHLYGHNIVRDLMAARCPSGRREELSKDLQVLIMGVYNEISNVFNQPVIKTDLLKPLVPTIKWFASSTADPITIGMAESKTGIVIGLPNYYNYERREDVPDNILEIRKMKLFKSWNKRDGDQEAKGEPPKLDGLNMGEDNISKTLINRRSPEAQQYIESILLSENAKKFSIARELFTGDSYKPLVLTGIIAISLALPVVISRAVVMKLHLANAHLTQRFPFYLVSGMGGYVHYICASDSANQFYTQKADERAMSINDSYREGAVEYFIKSIQRNKALREMVDDMRNSYDEDGNVREPFLRSRYKPLSERLEAAQQKKSEADQEKKID